MSFGEVPWTTYGVLCFTQSANVFVYHLIYKKRPIEICVLNGVVCRDGGWVVFGKKVAYCSNLGLLRGYGWAGVDMEMGLWIWVWKCGYGYGDFETSFIFKWA